MSRPDSGDLDPIEGNPAEDRDAIELDPAQETRRERFLLGRFEGGPLTPEAIASALGDAHDFGPGEAQEWAEEMVENGLLQPAGVPDAYELSDVGRAALRDGPDQTSSPPAG
jgi:hypothetical protein